MTIKEFINSIISRFSKNKMLAEPTMNEILESYDISTVVTEAKEKEKNAVEESKNNNGWNLVDLKLGGDYKAFFYETIPDKNNIISAQRVSELYSNDLSQNVEEKITKIFDMIVTYHDKIVGYVETIMLDDDMAMMSMQHQLAKIKFPDGIEDTDYLTDRNNVAIFVDDNFRKKGVGEQLFNATLKYLNHNGIKSLKMEDVREKAKGFYEKMGAEFEDEKTANINVANAIEKIDLNVKTKDIEYEK